MNLAKPKVLLLSAYDADSHRYWREGLVQNLPAFHWTVLTLPPRYFNWRIRGNPISWVYQHPETFAQNYDVVVATSMVDIAALKGLVPGLAATPSVVYFHENQFEYPKSDRQQTSVEAQMVNLYSALAADRIIFNSVYNRNTFTSGVDKLLRKLPDNVPAGIPQRLQKTTTVLPVPLDTKVFGNPHMAAKPKRFTLVWNHRWEYDKAPDRLYAALNILKTKGIEFDLRILGQTFRDRPDVFDRIKQDFSDQLINFGPIEDRQDYLAALRSSHLVISTAIHDFQGLALLEATAAGCLPTAPKRLAYPEFLPQTCMYQSHPDNLRLEAQGLAQLIMKAANQHKNGTLPPTPNLDHLSWDQLKADYIELLNNLISTP